MATPKPRPQDLMCGLKGYRPKWLQPYANARNFLIVFGLLGTIQSMSFLYFTITLSTLEKRFKIPSYITGFVLSGNEISQILLSLVLSYVGGKRNRPKWIAWGGVTAALSCFILAFAHFLYGPGDDATKLTAEYMYSNDIDSSLVFNLTAKPKVKSAHKLCMAPVDLNAPEQEYSIGPLIIIFFSQFVLGIGTTLYYTLGSPYLDDGTAKKNTPMMLAYAMSFRVCGMIVGFVLTAGMMRVYIDPWATPLIDHTDPRWMGAWWLGWYILGGAIFVSSLFIGLFPRVLPKKMSKIQMQVMAEAEARGELSNYDEEKPLQGLPKISECTEEPVDEDTFAKALKRMVCNKLIMYNTLGGVFYILGSSVFITYYSKYLEVQFNKSPSDTQSSLFTGPLMILSMASGILVSGYVISKYQPPAKKLFFFNVIVGLLYICGQFSNLFLACETGSFFNETGLINLTKPCNTNCGCGSVPYSPVCDEATGTTYFSPCHAGCKSWSDAKRRYADCECGATDLNFSETPLSFSTSTLRPDILQRSDAQNSNTTPRQKVFKSIAEEDTDSYYDEYDFETVSSKPTTASRHGRSVPDKPTLNLSMIPGACVAGCGMIYLTYTLLSCFINWMGSAARIGNILVNFRAIPVRDKSFAQGVSLFMVSLFAMIPGPIIFGYIIDSTCLIWNDNAGSQGNCQIYDQKRFRHYVNWAAMVMTAIATGFDVLVWWHGRGLELYRDDDEVVFTKKTKKVESNGAL